MTRRAVSMLVGPALLSALLGCSGTVGEAAGTEPSSPGQPTPPRSDQPGTSPKPGPGTQPGITPPAGCRIGPTPLRRLTRGEYETTVRDLVGDKGSPAEGLPLDAVRDGFDNDVTAQGTSPLLAGGYLKAAEKIAARVDLAPILGCPVATGDDACARSFVENFGKRAWRRPLRQAEATGLLSFFQAQKGMYGFEGAARMTLQLLLSSPQFLYRVEAPTGAATPHEAAARLSYTLWGSMPDDVLFAAADAGQLATKEQLGKQAERMLASPKARPRLRDFFNQWLALADLEDVMRDSKRYPGWSQSLLAAMATESITFAEKTLFDENGRFADLVSAPASYMNKALATYLGVTPAPAGTTFERMKLDPTRHAGLVTLSGPLAMNSNEDQPHPVYRGRWLRAQLLCHVPPPPPAALMVEAPKLSDKATTRAIFAQHSNDPSCAACHKLLDPIGFGLEQFDATGKWRTNDRGLPIDSSGEIVDAGDASGPFQGAVQLGQRLAGSDHAAGCLTTQLFRYARGRTETAEDSCALTKARTIFKEAGGNLKALVIAMTQTDDFLSKAGGK